MMGYTWQPDTGWKSPETGMLKNEANHHDGDGGGGGGWSSEDNADSGKEQHPKGRPRRRRSKRPAPGGGGDDPGVLWNWGTEALQNQKAQMSQQLSLPVLPCARKTMPSEAFKEAKQKRVPRRELLVRRNRIPGRMLELWH